MKRLPQIIAGAAIAALVGAYALAQTSIYVPNLNGQETWEVGQGASGSGYFINLNQARNTTGYQLLSSASGTIAPTAAVNSLLVNAQPANSTTINTPISSTSAVLSDGELFQVCNVTASAWSTNTVTLSAASGQTINGGSITLTTLAAHNCVELQYVLSSTTWYQVR